MYSFYTLISIAGILFGIMMTTILIVYPRITNRKSPSNTYLAIAFFCLSYVLFNAVLSSTGLYKTIPHFIFTAHIGAYLFMPMVFFYVRSVIRQQGIGWKDSIHFLPVLIYLVDMGSQIFISPQAKLDLLKTNTDTNDISLMIVVGDYLPPRFHLYFSSVLFVAYVIAKFSIVLRAYTDYGRNFIEENKEWIKWTTIYCIIEILLIAPVCVAIYYDKTANSKELWDKSSLLFSSLSIFSTIYLFLNPKILYGLSGAVLTENQAEENQLNDATPSEDNQQEALRKYSIYINAKDLDRLEELVTKRVVDEQKYLNSKYSVQDMAKDLGVSTKMVSAYLNHRMQMNFNDFINKLRVEYCCKLMEDPSNEVYTLERLSSIAGFGNRTTFVAAFKRFKQMSPSEYWKWVRSGEQAEGNLVSEIND